MLICHECGHHFCIGEESRWKEQHGEEMSGCPICRSAFEESSHCSKCLGNYLEDELYNGLCLECIANQITIDSFFEYIKSREYQADFYSFFFDCDITDSSLELDEVVEHHIRLAFQKDKLFSSFRKSDDEPTMEKIRSYIASDSETINDFAEWIGEQDGKRK